MKESRHARIQEIIAQKDIETQNQLMEALQDQGIKCTQATVSRDIKEMRLVKELSPEGRYRYTLSVHEETADFNSRLKKIFRESVTSLDIAQNIIVIKTLPGLAGGACAALDAISVPNLVGTLAGDDTAFLAMRDNEAATEFCSEIGEML